MLMKLLVDPAAILAFLFVLLLLLVAALVGLISPRILPEPCTAVLSILIDRFLTWKYPIKSEDGSKDLPTCPYRWPNGQGDVGKFLDGIENSSRWAKSYGTVYRIWSGTNSEVVLTRPEQLQAIFHDSDKHYKAVNNDSGFLMGQLLGECVGLISPPQWQNVRSVTEGPFRHHETMLRVGKVDEFVREYFHQLERGQNMRQGLLHPANDLKMLPFKVVCYFIYGPLSRQMEEVLESLAVIREDLMKDVIRGGISRFAFSRYLPLAANRRLSEFKNSWRQFNENAAQFAAAHHPDSPIVSMLDAVRNGKLSQEQLLQTLDEALFANLDVTTGGLSWNPVFLAAYPNCQHWLRQEIENIPDEAAYHKYLQSQSTYLQACILESSRLRPLAAFSVPQSAPTARIVDGYVIPAQTSVVVDAYALNVRNPYWGPDNETYRPERFLDRKNTELRYLFWRFGFGPRQCMGKYVADVILRATLAHLVKNFDLSITTDTWARDKETWITHPDVLVQCRKRLSENSRGF
ncbi:cytochrome P450 [Aspergillus floccosus]